MWKVLLLSFVCLSAFSLSLDERRLKIIEIIDEELGEVSRLAKQTRYRNPNHILRIAELNLEKGRLWREKENQEFLKLTNAQRRKTNKKRFFTKSQRYYDEAYRNCLTITKKYKNYKRLPDVYYILGFYAKEGGKNKTAAKYLGLASKRSQRKTKVNRKSTLSLAELYFNQAKFSKAIPLYEKALRAKRDKWWTKDSFNLAWCYYRVGKAGAAISKMKEIHSLSSRSEYIDMRELVERDIGVMFATSKRVEEGISFFKKLGVNFSGQLIGIAKSLKSQGKYSESQKVLAQALKYVKDDAQREEIYLEQLDLFSKYNRYSSHLSAARKLFDFYNKKKISSEGKERLLYEVQRQGAILQKQVLAKTYKRLPKIRKAKANIAVEYFHMSSVIDSKKRAEYLFLQAETAKVAGLNLVALKKYEETYKQGKGQFYKKSMDGMLYMLGQKGISRKTKEKWYPKVYETFLRDFKGDKREKAIYLKLFKVYFDAKNLSKSKSTLNRFAKRYQSDYRNQEAMIANLMEKDRKNNDYAAIKDWVSKIDKKEYNVSAKYKVKLQELLTSIQIDEVQDKLKKGNKKEAMAGYFRVLKDPYATKRARVNAKYNIAALYFELKDVNKSYEWSNKALDEMKSKDVSYFSSSFLTIANFYFMKQNFDLSINLLERLIRKLCNSKNRVKNTAFKNAAFMALADGKVGRVKGLIQRARACKVFSTYITDVEFELLKFYREKGQWQSYEQLISSLERNKKNRGQLISYLDKLQKVNEDLNNTKTVRSIERKKLSYYQEAKKKKYQMKVEDLDVIAEKEVRTLNSMIRNLNNVKLRFPEKSFNFLMKRKLKSLDQVTSKAILIQKIGSPSGIVLSYKSLIGAYRQVISDIQNFIPPGKSKEYISSFKKSMQSLTGPLSKTLNDYKRNLRKSVLKNDILNIHVPGILQDTETPVLFYSSNKGVLMDRRGIK